MEGEVSKATRESERIYQATGRKHDQGGKCEQLPQISSFCLDGHLLSIIFELQSQKL